ncbi:MAG TPA: hypothetical protein ENJ09_03010 [Planctomycetes bacterium]|nr:hypothetical protein [Planctomycetota bacterium]
MKLYPFSIAVFVCLGLATSCTEPDEASAPASAAGSAEAVDLDQRAAEAAAEINESNADEALQQLEDEISGGN